MNILKKHPEYLLYIAFGQSVIATLGSLYFSEILYLPACDLCWYQRIVMYPQVVLLGIGIMREDRNIAWYSLPLSLIGIPLATYHTALQYGWIPEIAAACRSGISCADATLALWGFVTIPLMALVGFIVVSASLYLYHRSVNSPKKA